MRILAVVAALLLAAGARTEEYRTAEPGYRHEFPRDHFAHLDFQSEWWYYTGNLFTPEGRRFGFELTFFRQGTGQRDDDSVWSLDNMYVAHFALSDIGAARFHHEERINRPGPGLAGASSELGRIWNGNWQVAWDGDTQRLQAVCEHATLRLELEPRKPPVIHEVHGGMGRASHYVSFTRLDASGELQLGPDSHALSGQAWMDHEFFTAPEDADDWRWDWFAIQLENGAELMLVRLREANNLTVQRTAGTYVGPEGERRYLRGNDLTLEPVSGPAWRSYPLEWRISVPPMGLVLRATTPLPGQEVADTAYTPTYWEGAMDFQGTLDGAAIRGIGYLEMTGYETSTRFGKAAGR